VSCCCSRPQYDSGRSRKRVVKCEYRDDTWNISRQRASKYEETMQMLMESIWGIHIEAAKESNNVVLHRSGSLPTQDRVVVDAAPSVPLKYMRSLTTTGLI
jgi:hypothetical protein